MAKARDLSVKHFRAFTTPKHYEIAHTLGLASPNNGLSIPSYMLGYNIAIYHKHLDDTDIQLFAV